MKKMKCRGIVLAMCALLFAGVVSLSRTECVNAATNDKVHENVYIGSTYIGGMNREEVTQALNDYISKLADTPIVLRGTNGSLEITADDIGLTWDEQGSIEKAFSIGNEGNLVARFKALADLNRQSYDLPVNYTVDMEKARFVLEENEADLIDATVDWGLERVDGEFQIIEGKDGTKINVEESIKAIIDYLNTQWKGGDISVDLVTEVAKPQGSREDLEMVTDELSSYTTDFGTKQNGRYYNVINGASLIDGSVVYPGETFSVYGAVSPLTLDNGYQMSTGYENGQVVDAVAGGICQVSTTLYNAVLYAELDIEERSAHSMLVSYVSPSRDAAIAGDYKDFKFVNTTDYPIYIDASWGGGLLTFTLYGHETRPSTHEIKFESEILSQEEAGLTVNEDPNQPVGYVNQEQGAFPATSARLWKITLENGVETDRKVINNSSYIASNKVITVGTATDVPEIKEQILAAIATNDEGTIRSIAGTYAGVTSAGDMAAAEAAAAEAAAAAAAAAQTGEAPAVQ